MLLLVSGAAVLSAYGRAQEDLPRLAQSDIPIRREHHYTLDGRVRPLLLFWIGRKDIGDARITWRDDGNGRRGFELLIGSDPLRAPRKINRWGFIAETYDGERAETFGIMKESGEETLEEAEARIAGEDGGMAIFKASRNTITSGTASGGTMSIAAPAHLTYRDLDKLLAGVPEAPAKIHTVRLAPDTHIGFLVALDALILRSIDSCRRGNAAATPAVTYVYNQTLYDLSLESCDHDTSVELRTAVFHDVVDGRFQVQNRSTRNQTTFRVMYEASGPDQGVPVRALFRPRWWLEVELIRTGRSRG